MGVLALLLFYFAILVLLVCRHSGMLLTVSGLSNRVIVWLHVAVAHLYSIFDPLKERTISPCLWSNLTNYLFCAAFINRTRFPPPGVIFAIFKILFVKLFLATSSSTLTLPTNTLNIKDSHSGNLKNNTPQRTQYPFN